MEMISECGGGGSWGKKRENEENNYTREVEEGHLLHIC